MVSSVFSTSLQTPEDENLPLQYAIYQNGQVKIGKDFNVSRQLLHQMGLPPVQFMELTTENVRRSLVFVTAASANHYHESTLAISSVQSIFPDQPMLYFDLGLMPIQVKKVSRLSMT